MNTRSEKHKLSESLSTESRIIHKGNLLTFKCDKIIDASSKVHEYDIVLHPGAVVVVPLDNKERLYFVKQWRRAVKKIIIELPAGILEKDETPLNCALRELQEEIGYKPKRLTSLGGFYTAPGFCNEFLHMFVAQDLIPSALQAEDTNHIDILTLSLEEALKAIELQQIVDAKTLCGIYRYQQWKNNKRK